MKQQPRDIQRKLRILEHANHYGSVVKTCRYFGIGCITFFAGDLFMLHKVSVG